MGTDKTKVDRTKTPSRIKTVVLILACAVILGLLSAGGLYLYTRDTGLILEGIKVGKLDLSNLSTTIARQKLEEHVTSILDQPVEFQVRPPDPVDQLNPTTPSNPFNVASTPPQPETVKLTFRNLGLSFDIEKSVQQASLIGHEGGPFKKALAKWRAQNGNSLSLPLSFHWNKEQLQKSLLTSFASYNHPMNDASFKITTDNRMEIEREKPGQEVNSALLTEKIESLDPLHPTPVLVPLQATVQPKVTASQLEGMKITGLVSKYSTQFDPGLVNRTENIRLAAKALNGKLLAPGEKFSFNQSVGERTASAGYKEAMIIVGEQFTPGLGGGVCQVSSTLYNAALLAHIDILERHPHSLAITYVPQGQDATVAYPDLDLKFKNSTSGYLLLRSFVQGSTLTFELYGRQ